MAEQLLMRLPNINKCDCCSPLLCAFYCLSAIQERLGSVNKRLKGQRTPARAATVEALNMLRNVCTLTLGAKAARLYRAGYELQAVTPAILLFINRRINETSD